MAPIGVATRPAFAAEAACSTSSNVNVALPRERDECESAQGLSTISAIVKEVTFRLNQNSPVGAGEESNCEMVGQCAGRQPYGSLLAEHGGHTFFEAFDTPARE
jgi:hypothetical protein